MRPRHSNKESPPDDAAECGDRPIRVSFMTVVSRAGKFLTIGLGQFRRKKGQGRRTEEQESRPVVDVVNSDDVVLSEVAPCLHFDEFQVDLAGIGETVIRTNRQID